MSKKILIQPLEDRTINENYVEPICGKFIEELSTEGIDTTNSMWKVNTICDDCKAPYFCHPSVIPHSSCDVKFNIDGSFPFTSLTAAGNCAECLSFNVVCKPDDHILCDENKKIERSIKIYDWETGEDILMDYYFPLYERNYEVYYQSFLKILKTKLHLKKDDNIKLYVADFTTDSYLQNRIKIENSFELFSILRYVGSYFFFVFRSKENSSPINSPKTKSRYRTYFS